MSDEPKGVTKESHRTVTTRTEAAMAAIISLRQELAAEQEIGRSGSAYMTIRGILYDLFDGAYWDGYGTGEDQSGYPVPASPDAKG